MAGLARKHCTYILNLIYLQCSNYLLNPSWTCSGALFSSEPSNLPIELEWAPKLNSRKHFTSGMMFLNARFILLMFLATFSTFLFLLMLLMFFYITIINFARIILFNQTFMFHLIFIFYNVSLS